MRPADKEWSSYMSCLVSPRLNTLLCYYNCITFNSIWMDDLFLKPEPSYIFVSVK